MIDARDVGHDAEGEHREPPQRAAREDVEEAEDRAGRRLEEGVDRRGVDAGRRDVRAEAVDRQHQEREHDPLAQVGDVEDVEEALERAQRDSTSQRPPAASIRALADAENLWADTVSAFLISPSPRILTGRLLRDEARRRDSASGVTAAPGLEAVEVGEVHDVVLDAEDVREAALGHPAVERHLAALEAPLVAVAGARLLALVAAAGGLAVAAAGAAADALAVVRRAGRRARGRGRPSPAGRDGRRRRLLLGTGRTRGRRRPVRRCRGRPPPSRRFAGAFGPAGLRPAFFAAGAAGFVVGLLLLDHRIWLSPS